MCLIETWTFAGNQYFLRITRNELYSLIYFYSITSLEIASQRLLTFSNYLSYFSSFLNAIVALYFDACMHILKSLEMCCSVGDYMSELYRFQFSFAIIRLAVEQHVKVTHIRIYWLNGKNKILHISVQFSRSFKQIRFL